MIQYKVVMSKTGLFPGWKNVNVQIAVSKTLVFLNLTVELVPGTQGLCGVNYTS